MTEEQERLITENVSIVSQVVARELSRGLMPWADKTDLEDVARLALVEAAIAYDGSRPFAGFAYKRAHNAVLDELRKFDVRNRDRGEMPEDIDRQVPNESDMDVWEALKTLSPRQYRAVILTYWGGSQDPINGNPRGMSREQVAQEMGISPDSVKDLLARAKERAKKNLRTPTPKPKSRARIRVTEKRDGIARG